MLYRYERGRGGALVKKALVWTQNEHGIDAAGIDKEAVHIVQVLRKAGFETYIVGGAVRDLILGKTPKDFDIATDAAPNQIKRYIRNARIIGKRFRLVHVYYGEKIYEIATFRSTQEGTTSNVFGTIGEDVMRRDFTCNALFYDPLKNVVVDYVGGLKDIHKKILRPVIPLNIIFRDDPVRMIRAVKYAAASGFTLPASIKNRIKREAHLLSGISTSRLAEELAKIVRSDNPLIIIEALFKNGLWQYLQPKAAALMKSDSAFLADYMRGFAALPSNKQKGGRLAALIRPYLERQIDWAAKDAGADYKSVFCLARGFIAPAGLPRFEVEAALALVFSEHGITLHKPKRPRRYA